MNGEACCQCNWNSGPFEIFTGQDKTMSMRVVQAANGLPLDLTECTAISVALPNADGSFTNLTLADSEVTITDPTNLGSFTVNITNEVSALLNVGVLQNIDVSFTISSLVTIVRFFQALSVLEAN